MCQLPKISHQKLLVGLEFADDAGVYQLDKNTALIQTVDFFTPIVDDPYLFGTIAAANALSDVYAMGGVPLTALNIVAFPLGVLSEQVLKDILRGGLAKIQEAGAILLGGHSIQDPEPKYGLAVTGVAHPSEIWTNRGAKKGDVLILTKPLGIGIITSALRKKKDQNNLLQTVSPVPDAIERKAIEVMSQLNDKACETGKMVGIHSCTDITGFGLLGHAWEIAKASQVQIEIDYQAVPIIKGTQDLAAKGYIAGGNWSNLEYMISKVEYGSSLDEIAKHILVDPITSGGLLMAVAEKKSQELLELLHQNGVVEAQIVGKVYEGEPKIKVI